jgi:hypothetical protein
VNELLLVAFGEVEPNLALQTLIQRSSGFWRVRVCAPFVHVFRQVFVRAEALLGGAGHFAQNHEQVQRDTCDGHDHQECVKHARGIAHAIAGGDALEGVRAFALQRAPRRAAGRLKELRSLPSGARGSRPTVGFRCREFRRPGRRPKQRRRAEGNGHFWYRRVPKIVYGDAASGEASAPSCA